MDRAREAPEPKASTSSAAADLPSARVTRWRWSVAVIWIVPLVAAIFSVYLVYDRLKDRGPEITIRFRDGSGVRVGQTPVRYRGVQVGEVTAVRLSEDQEFVEVKVRLLRSAAAMSREGAVFWIARPEVGIGSVTGLNTVITGPEILALPGKGNERSEFAGMESAPAALEQKGLKIVLRAERVGSVQRNSPVYYRGVEVGVVQEATLAGDAATPRLHVLIFQPYVPLVRVNSVFWNVSGASFSAGLFKGVQFKMESLRSLAAGGINFATPDAKSAPAKEGQVYSLHASGRPEWNHWAPRIKLGDDVK
jgi:paraquat-inducible protein B